MKTICIFFILLFLISGMNTVNGAERISLPEGVHYHRFASSISSPEAIWVNPAILGESRDINLQYIGELGVGRLNKNWGYNIVGDGISIGFRHIDNIESEKYDEYTFACGAGIGPKFLLGASYRYVKNGSATYNKKHFWNLGILIKPSPRLNIATLFSNLNRSRIDGKRSDIEQLYSFSYKSFSEKIVLSVEIALSTGQNLSRADYNYGVEITPIRGLTLYGNLRDNDSFEAGFRINLRKYFVGCQSRFDSNGSYIGAPSFVGYNSGLQHSIIP